MPTVDWTAIGTIASTVALVMGGFLWLASKIFNIGKASHRLDAIETDLAELKHNVPEQINALGARLDQRMDKLILTIAESNKHR
jgi:hypothetical protein